MMGRCIGIRVAFVALALAWGTAPARGGSTEPELAVADVAASSSAGVVTVEVVANFDYDNAIRLGYPLAVVATQSDQEARLYLDGTVTLASGGGPPAPVPGAPGVVAIRPTRLSAALPPSFTAAGAATVRLEASFDGNTLRSNSVAVQW